VNVLKYDASSDALTWNVYCTKHIAKAFHLQNRQTKIIETGVRKVQTSYDASRGGTQTIRLPSYGGGVMAKSLYNLYSSEKS